MKQKRVVSVSFFLMGVLYCICLVVSNLFGTKFVQVGSYSMTAGLIVSTLAGEGADSLIFFPLAFGGLMPVQDLLKMMLLQVTAKTLYEILALPITIQVVKFVKKWEEYSAYDMDVSYNILKINDI